MGIAERLAPISVEFWLFWLLDEKGADSGYDLADLSYVKVAPVAGLSGNSGRWELCDGTLVCQTCKPGFPGARNRRLRASDPASPAHPRGPHFWEWEDCVGLPPVPN